MAVLSILLSRLFLVVVLLAGLFLGVAHAVAIFARIIFLARIQIASRSEQSGFRLRLKRIVQLLAVGVEWREHCPRSIRRSPGTGRQRRCTRRAISEALHWGNVVLFGRLLVVGLSTMGYIVRSVLSNTASGNEAA